MVKIRDNGTGTVSSGRGKQTLRHTQKQYTVLRIEVMDGLVSEGIISTHAVKIFCLQPSSTDYTMFVYACIDVVVQGVTSFLQFVVFVTNVQEVFCVISLVFRSLPSPVYFRWTPHHPKPLFSVCMYNFSLSTQRKNCRGFCSLQNKGEGRMSCNLEIISNYEHARKLSTSRKYQSRKTNKG